MENLSMFDLVDAGELLDTLKWIAKSLEQISSAISTTIKSEDISSHGDIESNNKN